MDKKTASIRKSLYIQGDKMKKVIFTIIAILLIVGCAKTKEERAIKNSDNNITLQLEATIYPSKQDSILAGATGFVKKVYVKNGDRVKKGDLIYELDTELIKLDIKRLEYDIQSLKKEQNQKGNDYNLPAVNMAAIELKKVAALRSKGAVNQFEEDTYIKNYITALNAKKTATTSEEATKRAIASDEVAIAKLKYALKHANVKADIDGFVVNLNVQKGESVTLNQKVGDIINIDNVIVRAGLAQGLLAFVSKGEKVKINFITEPPYSQMAKIARINPIIDKKFQNMAIDIIVKNKNYILQPGTKALVTIYLTEEQQKKVKKIFYDRKDKVIQIPSNI
jgi:RND family efflux transporter MFP subunit